MIAILDYGAGNLRSVQKAFEALGHDAILARDPSPLAVAHGMVLPGVGSFADCMAGLERAGFVGHVLEWIEADRPFLGICVGLQLLFEASEEDGDHKGLGVLAGRVRRLPADQKVPQMGWNQVRQVGRHRVFSDVPDLSDFYFVHSYYPGAPDDVVIGLTEYGVEFASAVARGNLHAVQFHPEKSGDIGLKLLDNFARLAKESGR